MNSETLPPVRSTHTWRAPGGSWCYDMWGRHGRPVLLLPAIMFDRVMWWPAAADLRAHTTVVAVDLPGHGASAARDRYDPYELVDELAQLLYRVGVHRAPVIVGHGSSAPLAVLFAASYATHAVVTVDAPDSATCVTELPQYLDDLQLDAVAAPYSDMLTPGRDPRLLAAYTPCRTVGEPPGAGLGRLPTPHRLAVHSQAPPRRHPDPGTPADSWRHEVYDVPGCFAHLADVPRFVSDIRGLL